jgi:hypothetical protein
MDTLTDEQQDRLAQEFARCAQWIEPSLELSHGAYQLGYGDGAFAVSAPRGLQRNVLRRRRGRAGTNRRHCV